MELGEILRIIRSFNDMTLTELSRKHGISQGYLSDIERGKKEPTLEILKMYSKQFSISLSGILFFYENGNEPKKLRKIRHFFGRHFLKMIKYIYG